VPNITTPNGYRCPKLEKGQVWVTVCGLFGMLRSPTAEHPDRASKAFVMLGFLAEERGQHAAGMGLVTKNIGRATTGEVTHLRDVTVAGCRIVKDLGRFSHVWKPELLPEVNDASIALGHTRSATQGAAHHLVNASPLLVARLVGTHNGDIEPVPLRARYSLPAPVGGTDTEVMYQAIATAGRDTRKLLDVLRCVIGRAAIAWIDQAALGRLHLARTAVSPLALAVDGEHNLYWASNPGWFRTVARRTSIRFTSIVLVREGTYLAVTNSGRPRIRVRRRFSPTARISDRARTPRGAELHQVRPEERPGAECA
jgi:glucosamine--fructose-6-phosphate aminotransferase (isomerizing)